jgi:hypothetical protein
MLIKDSLKLEIRGFKEFKASLKLKEYVRPVYQKARQVPYSIREKVDREYDWLIQADILHEVEHSDWASPVVHVPKEMVISEYVVISRL